MVEIKDFKEDRNIILRFLTLSSENDKLDDEMISAWRRVTGSKKNIALRLYEILLKSRKGEFTEELSQNINEPIHNVRRSLNDLKELGLIEKKKRKRNRVISDFWSIKEKVEGLLRIISTAEIETGIRGEEEFWFDKYKELSKHFMKYTGFAWMTRKNIHWQIEKDGLMSYDENREYLKLSDITPPFNYITLFAKSDEYDLKILDSNQRPFEISTEIYEHQNKKLNIVNALLPQDTYKSDFQKLSVGEPYKILISDKKRLYACPKSNQIYMACFPYQINLENIDTLELQYKIHENINPISCGIWFDNHKEFEVNLIDGNSMERDNMKMDVKKIKNYLEFNWQGKFLLNKAQVLKFLFEFEPKFESDRKQWIKLYEAIDCPFCHKIPFDTIGRI